MALPPSTDFTGSAVTEGGFKTAITSLVTYLSGLFGSTGTQATALSTLGAPWNATSTKTTAYTVVAADRGKSIECTTGTFTVTGTACATLGDGFVVTITNSGTGTITFDPNGAETVDGAATDTVGSLESKTYLCNGTAWRCTSVKSAKSSTLGSPVTTTSGTSVDFTGIPSWAKRVTVLFDSVSTSGSSPVQVQIGTSGGIQTTSYSAVGARNAGSAWGSGTASSGFILEESTNGNASNSRVGSMTITLMDTSSGKWAASGVIGSTAGDTGARLIAGTKSLSGTLDRVRITTVNGTDTFDAGSINVIWE